MNYIPEIIADIKFRLGKRRIRRIQGFQMWIDTKEPSYSIRKTLRYYDKVKSHEPATTKLFKNIVKPGSIVVDVGANMGYFSLLAKSLGAEKVYAFEPESKNYDYLKTNAMFSDYSWSIEAKNIAISDTKGKERLYLCSYDSGHHTIKQDRGIKDYRKVSLARKIMDRFKKEKFIEIETSTLDDEIEGRVDIIKLDCEGSEALALKGMKRILAENKNIKMVVEFFPMLLERMGSSPEAFINKLLLAYNFEMYIIPHDYSAGEVIKKVESYEDLMSYLPKEDSHVNLFLRR